MITAPPDGAREAHFAHHHLNAGTVLVEAMREPHKSTFVCELAVEAHFRSNLLVAETDRLCGDDHSTGVGAGRVCGPHSPQKFQ